MGISGEEEDHGTSFLRPSSAGGGVDHQLYVEVQELRRRIASKDKISGLQDEQIKTLNGRLQGRRENRRKLEQEIDQCANELERVTKGYEVRLASMCDEYESKIREQNQVLQKCKDELEDLHADYFFQMASISSEFDAIIEDIAGRGE